MKGARMPLTKDRVDEFLAEVYRTVEIPDALAIGYALGKLSPDEKVRLEELLAACPDARAELDALREAASAWRRNSSETRPAPAAATKDATERAAPVQAPEPLRRRFAEAAAWFGEAKLSPALASVAFATADSGQHSPIHWSLRPTAGGVRVRIASEHTGLEGVRLKVTVDRRVYLLAMAREWPDVVSTEFTIDYEEGDPLPEKPTVAIAVMGQDGPKALGARAGMPSDEGSG